MIRIGVAGLGKMGLSHLAMLRTHPAVSVDAVCDSSSYVVGVLSKYTSLVPYADFDEMIGSADLDAVVIATPSRTHAPMARKALARGLHVFCEKPLTLDPNKSEQLAQLAAQCGAVTQVGYHNRFVGAFEEVRRLLDWQAIGTVTSARGEAYGPVVLKPKGSTWRSRREEGGGCLHDYAAHPLDLLCWYLGEPTAVGGTALSRVFSRETDDEVATTLFFPDGRTGQVTANWSDESHRKMTTQINIWGTGGRIYADRQECRTYLRSNASIPPGYEPGWNVRYTTDLTNPVWFYLRGEEYSAQLDYWLERIRAGLANGTNDFASAAATDRVVSKMIIDSGPGNPTRDAIGPERHRRRTTSRAGAGGLARVLTQPIFERRARRSQRALETSLKGTSNRT